MSTAPRHLRRIAPAAALLVLFGSPAAPQYEQGSKVVVTGRVADENGAAIPGARVRLRASHAQISLRRMGRVKGHPAEVATGTGSDGEYALEWEWHDFYNRFDLTLELPIADAAGPGVLELVKLDITERVRAGSPVAVAITPGPSEALTRHLEFFARLTHEVERRVFEQLGPPDQVDRLRLGEHDEVTWWYFRGGKAYRFRDERLDEVVSFDPVAPF